MFLAIRMRSSSVHFRSFADLNRDCAHLIASLPTPVDVVAGIPRSGLLAANLCALHLNVTLADLDGFLEGRFLTGGQRLSTGSDTVEPDPAKRTILVLDDSVLTGRSMAEARRKIEESGAQGRFIYGAVYASPDAIAEVDLYADVVPQPRVFEWNLFHHRHLKRCCVDIDGVLCRDPTDQENDDSSRYLKFLETVGIAQPSSYSIGCIVTSRLEKYRSHTEEWLQRHGIRYDRLEMASYPDAESRRRARRHGLDKAEIYRDESYVLFIESSRAQADVIARHSGKLVYCVDDRQMIHPGVIPATRRSLWALIARCRKTISWLKSKTAKAVRDPVWAAQRAVELSRKND